MGFATETAAADAGVTSLATVFHACHRELCHFEKDVSFEIVNVMEIIGESMGIQADDVYKRLKMMDDIDSMIDDCKDLITRHGLDVDDVRETLLADQLAARPLQGRICRSLNAPVGPPTNHLLENTVDQQASRLKGQSAELRLVE